MLLLGQGAVQLLRRCGQLLAARCGRLSVLAGGAFRPRPLCLRPSAAVVQPRRGFKVKKWLKLRCPFCYFIRIDGRLHVECKKHPRHKQREPFDQRLLW